MTVRMNGLQNGWATVLEFTDFKIITRLAAANES